MTYSRLKAAAFSLVEVTLAFGIAAFCLIAVFGLVPVGVQTNRNATSQTAATNILSSVVSDIRASPKGDRHLCDTELEGLKATLRRCALTAKDSLMGRSRLETHRAEQGIRATDFM